MSVIEPKLTELTSCGGCAAKRGADILVDALAGLRSRDGGARDDRLIVGLDEPDDAAAYALSPDVAVLGTVDFFPPLVDDPYTYGAIAAANAMSDIFAMGGEVLYALSIAAFPEKMPSATLHEIFGGASDTVREAGGFLAGGHTINDDEPKYGLAVIGQAHPERLLRKNGAMPGDVLILTKRLGTGLLLSGNRRQQVRASHLEAAMGSMRRLNLSASRVLVEHGVRAATDVTGFGLLGHAAEMATGAGARFVISTTDLPALDGAAEAARTGFETGGAAHNRRFVAPLADHRGDADSTGVRLAYDPQTSGGLLAAVPEAWLPVVVADLERAEVECWQVGHVESGPTSLTIF